MGTGWVLPLFWIIAIIDLPIRLFVEPAYISENTWEFIGQIAFIVILTPFMWGIFFPKKERISESSLNEPSTFNPEKIVNELKEGKYDQHIVVAARTIKKVGENVAKGQIEKLSNEHPEISKHLTELGKLAKKFKP